MSTSTVEMEGFVMKRKGGDLGTSKNGGAGSAVGRGRRSLLRRSMSTKWVKRYFVLHRDGRLVYYKDRPTAAAIANGNHAGATTEICADVTAECDIDPVTPAEIERDPANNVANSFYVTHRSTGARTLLVTNGPEEYTRWILSFRGLKSQSAARSARDLAAAAAAENRLPPVAAVAVETAAVASAPKPAAAVAKKDQTAKEAKQARLQKERLEKERLEAEKSERERLEEEQRLAKEEEERAEKEEQEKRQREEEEAKKARLEEEEKAAAQAVPDEAPSGGECSKLSEPKLETGEPATPPQSNETKEGEEDDSKGVGEIPAPTPVAVENVQSVKSLKEERRKELQKFMRDRSLEKDKRKSFMDGVKERYAVLIAEAEANEARVEEEKKKEAKKEKELASIENILMNDDAPTPEGQGDGRLHCVHAAKDAKDLAGDEEAAKDKRNDYEKALANQEVIVDMIDEFGRMTESEIGMAAKVFARGRTLDELEGSLASDDGARKALFGVLVTSLREMTTTSSSEAMDPMTAGEKEERSPLAAFSLEYEGGNADVGEVKKLKSHLNLIDSFCKKHLTFEEVHRVAYAAGDARGQILERLGGGNEEGGGEGDAVQPQSAENNNVERKFDPSTYSDAEKTAYKHALEVLGSDNVPSGDELMKQLRQPRGFPYNWVLFEPSKKELIVKDAGSGGVMEITKLLQEGQYDDVVLFGYIRLSFSSEDVGRRQFWVGLEWKGENCFGVRAMRQFRECSGPMAKLVGDRSFTLSNVAASEMTLQLFVNEVKKNCNSINDFKVTVETMKNAHLQEQDEIKEYWKKAEEGKAAQKKKKREAEEERERSRRERIEVERRSHAARRSGMGAGELLGDLGKDGVCGWALLEF